MTRLLSVREVADALALSPRTVLRMVAAGTLPAFRFDSGSLRIAEADLDAFLDARRTVPHTAAVVVVPEVQHDAR